MTERLRFRDIPIFKGKELQITLPEEVWGRLYVEGGNMRRTDFLSEMNVAIEQLQEVVEKYK
jgi:hypothetical protein